MPRIWILGAPDPEMEAIEGLLRECGEEIIYATDADGRRVHPGNAYRCPVPEVPEHSTVYAVECIDKLPPGWKRVDHHRPGDPGYGQPPSKFLPASSIGQVIAELARLVPLYGWETIAGPSWEPRTYELTTVDRDHRVWRSDPGVYDTGSGEWDWAVSFAVGCWHLVPRDLVLAAAADHCLAAAYRGECPGVDPDALMRWRVETRAAFQKRPAEDILADVERAREALHEAPRIDLGAEQVCDMRDAYTINTVLVEPFTKGATVDSAGIGDATFIAFGARAEGTSDEGGHHTFVRRGVPELPEAAAREGVAYLSLVADRDGRKKIVLGGHTTPETVKAFMEHWAPGQGLVDVYGDPARSFAGGYTTRPDDERASA